MSMRLYLIITLMCALGFSAFAADESFETLAVGKDSFTNVTVLNKNRSDVFISHSRGMANLKVKDLDLATQLKLGYQIEMPRPKKTEALMKAVNMDRLESDPRVQEAEALVTAKFAEAIDQLDPRIFYGFIAALIFSYLSFCSLCRSICMKSANAPAQVIPLIWLPLLKQIPLLKAAGMSPWWILTNIIPVLPLVPYIIWSIKITQTRGKHIAFGIMLLLPVTNIFAFLYLAMSGDGKEEGSDRRNVITLDAGPRREAA